MHATWPSPVALVGAPHRGHFEGGGQASPVPSIAGAICGITSPARFTKTVIPNARAAERRP